MARLLKSTFGLLVNLDGNVGSSGGNARSDVGVMQFALLLMSSGARNPLNTGQGGGLSVPGQGPIAVDGFYGPQTAAYIAAYQAQRARTPGPAGNALPAPNGNFGSFRSTAWNFSLLQSDVGVTAGDFIDLARADPRCPPFVRQSFFT